MANQLVVSTHLKNMFVKLDHFPRDEHKRIFETTTQQKTQRLHEKANLFGIICSFPPPPKKKTQTVSFMVGSVEKRWSMLFGRGPKSLFSQKCFCFYNQTSSQLPKNTNLMTNRPPFLDQIYQQK